jgi:hypothetical protein
MQLVVPRLGSRDPSCHNEYGKIAGYPTCRTMKTKVMEKQKYEGFRLLTNVAQWTHTLYRVGTDGM